MADALPVTMEKKHSKPQQVQIKSKFLVPNLVLMNPNGRNYFKGQLQPMQDPEALQGSYYCPLINITKNQVDVA